MRKSKNLSKAALEIINNVNNILRVRKIKDNGNELFCFACDYLLKHNMYHGYNMFVLKQDPTDETNKFIVEAGSATDYEFLQIYNGPGCSIGERSMKNINY